MPSLRFQPGVIRGESREMISGRFYDTNLIRWHESVMKPVGGWERITQNALGSVPRAAFSWSDNNFLKHLAFMCDGHVYRMFNSNLFDITPVDWRNADDAQSARGFGSGAFGVGDFGMDDEPRGGGVAENAREEAVFPVKFSMENWGDELLFGSSGDGRVMVWDPADPDTAPFASPNAPSLVQGFIATDEHHLMTFGADGFPNRVAWSDQGNREGFDYTDVTGQAGFYDLEGGGAILTWCKVTGGVLIFTTRNVWIGRYIGQPNFYGFTKLAEKCSPISPQAVAVGGDRAFWLGRQSFWKYEAGAVTALPCDLGTLVFEDLDRINGPKRVCAGFNGVYPEIWFCYPTKGQNVPSVENNRYVIFNFKDNWWAPGYLARTFLSSSNVDDSPLGGSTDCHVFQHEVGYMADGQNRKDMVFAEVGMVSFDDGDNNYTVTKGQVAPGATNPECIEFTFTGARQRGGERLVFGPFVPRPDGYLDMKFTCREFSMRVQSKSDVGWALGALNLSSVKRGPR